MSTRPETTPRTEPDVKEARVLGGQAAVWQTRLILLVMLNVAQLWILSATVEAALAHHYRVLLALVLSSGICWLISLSISFWWRPVSRRYTSTGYIRNQPQ